VIIKTERHKQQITYIH